MVVVGLGNTPSGHRAFRWENGVMTGLGDLPGGDFKTDTIRVGIDYYQRTFERAGNRWRDHSGISLDSTDASASWVFHEDAMARGSGSGPEDGRGGTAWARLELAVCGNGVVESGEDCDDGNTEPGDCCSPTCQYESAVTVCRHVAGVCDSEEFCDGVSADCPPDLFLPPVTACRAAASACDAEEFCDGVSAGCPPDLYLPAGTECRASAGVCDRAWFCNGVSPYCDPIVDPPPIVCRPSAGVCDPEEICDGVNPDCPPDFVFPPGTICRASSGLCDIAEVCNEFLMCPSDAYEPPTTECRPAAGVCDIAENCTGSGPSCPDDAVLDGVPCPDGEVCNGDETCEVGVCMDGTPIDCDDLDECTADSCDQLLGCFNDPIPACNAVPATSNWGQALLAAMLLMAGALIVTARRENGAASPQ